MQAPSQGSSDNIYKMSDEALAHAAAAGDDNAFAALISRYMRAVKARAQHYKSCGTDAEDLTQEGLIGLMAAVRSYDSTAAASFKTYAGLCIDRSMITAVRAALAKKQIPNGMLVELDESGCSATSDDPAALYIAKENLKRFYKNAAEQLSAVEYRVLREYLAGLSYREIAERLGVPAKTVDNAMRRVRRKLK